jgi:hypothetical protein
VREALLQAAKRRRLLDGMGSGSELRRLLIATPCKLTRVELEIALAERTALMSPSEAFSYARWLLAPERGWSKEVEASESTKPARGEPALADASGFLLEEELATRAAPTPCRPPHAARSSRRSGARSWLHFQRPASTFGAPAPIATFAMAAASAATSAPVLTPALAPAPARAPARLAARMRPERDDPADMQATAEAVLALVGTDGPGEPLAGEVIVAENGRFGELLGRVRIHTSSIAAQAAQLLGASAFTIGHDIYFAAGEYSPGSEAGDRLLRHELTHVRQHERGELAAEQRASLLERSSSAEVEARAAEETSPKEDWAGLGKNQPTAVVERARREGQRIALPFRQELEEELGTSFDFVETYTGKAAQLACEVLGASAFVVQNLVMLADPSPQRELLLHELTHIQQMGQKRAPARFATGALKISHRDDAAEVEARSEIGPVAVPAVSADPNTIHRAEPGDSKEPKGTPAERIAYFAAAAPKESFGVEGKKDEASGETYHAFHHPTTKVRYQESSPEPFRVEHYKAILKNGPATAGGVKKPTGEVTDNIASQDLARLKAEGQKYRFATVTDRTYAFIHDGAWMAKVDDGRPNLRKEADPIEQFEAYFAAVKVLRPKGRLPTFRYAENYADTECTFSTKEAEAYRAEMREKMATAYARL